MGGYLAMAMAFSYDDEEYREAIEERRDEQTASTTDDGDDGETDDPHSGE